MAQPSNPDRELIQRAARGNRKAFTTLFHRHFQPVYNYALMLCRDPALAEDLTQEAFIRAHNNLDRFGPPWNFKAWIFRLTHNYFLDLVRKDREVDPLEDDEKMISDHPGPEKETQLFEAADRIQNTLDRLRSIYREILVLRELHGFSYAEIGEILDLSDSNVKVMIHRARANFREIYGFQLLLEDPSGDCQEVAKLLHELHDGEEIPDQEQLVKEHLKVCEACQRRKQWLVEQSMVFGALIPVIPPKELAQRILRETIGFKTWRPAQKIGRVLLYTLGFGGAVGLVVAAAWILLSLLGGYPGDPDISPPAREESPEEVLAPEAPIPSDTAVSPLPPDPPSPTPSPNPPTPSPTPSPTSSPTSPTPSPTSPTPSPEPVTSSRCDVFDNADISVILLPIPEETMILPLYFKISGGVPCLGVESPVVSEPCQFSATIGNTKSYSCGLQGFEDRLYCMFNITPDLPGLAFDLELELNECQEPVYVLPNVTIPEVRPQTSEDPLPTCTKDLDQETCEAAGGEMSSGINAAPYCICP